MTAGEMVNRLSVMIDRLGRDVEVFVIVRQPDATMLLGWPVDAVSSHDGSVIVEVHE